MCMGGVSYVVGGCDVVAMLRMAGMVCLELVLQADPFLCSTDSLSVCGTQREGSLMFGFTISLQSIY